MSIALELIVIIFAIFVFVFLTVKGLGPIVSGLIAGAIVSLIAIGGFSANLFGTFLNGMTSMFGAFFVLFSCGMAFGGTLAACGASDRMGVTFVRVMGEKNFIYAIVVVSILFGLTGAPPLALMPALCFGMLKSANLPRYIAMTAVAGTTAFSLTSVPGTLGSGNVICSAALGTDVYSAPLLGIVATVVGAVLLCLYLRYLINDARKKGIGYDPIEGNAVMGGGVRSDDDMPSFVCSIIPVIVLLGGCAVLILGFGMESLPSVFFSTVVGILLLIVLNRKYFHSSILATIRDSVIGIQGNIVGAIAVCGFAAVISATDLYQRVIAALLNSTISPYILVVLGTFILSALCADCIGGVASFANTIGATLVNAGVNAAVVHRLANITSSVFDSMPHGGSIILALTQFGYDHKKGYKYLVVSNIAIPFIYTVVALIVALIAY